MIRFLPLVLLMACAQPQGRPVDINSLMNRDQLSAVKTPLLAARLTSAGTLATMVPVGRNGAVVTWQSGDQVSLSLDHGIIVATRGLGHDLMSADVSETRDVLAGQAQGTDYTLIHSYLDGEYQVTFRAFRCRKELATAMNIEIVQQSHSVTRIEESCFSDQGNIANTYWVGGDGTVWKSKQWVSPALGYMETELLVR